MGSAKNFEKNFLLSLTTIVVLLGSFIFRNMSAEVPVNKKIDVAQNLSRGPASVEMIQEKLPAYKFSKSLSVVVKCEAEHKIDEVFGSHLRLLGTSCNDSIQVAVKNLSNGYTATVFNTKDNSFTTDFIDLADGENIIEIEHLNHQGTLQKNKLRIHRAVATEK